MRFRGLISEAQQIQTLIRVLQSLAKFSETFLFRLSQNELQLLNDLCHTSSAFVVRAVLKCDDYFEEYTFRGNNSDNNLIYFRLRSESLSQVLASLLPHIKALKLKLSKVSGGPVLSLAVNYPTTGDSDRIVCHQIRIEIINSEEWNQIWEQDLHSFDLSLCLSDSRPINTTTERLNDLCHYIEIKAKRVDTKVCLTICVDTDSISVTSKFYDLELNTSVDIDSNTNVSEDLVAVRIDVRKMNLLFNTLKVLKPTSIISNISDKNKICFLFFHNLVNFEAFLPNIEI